MKVNQIYELVNKVTTEVLGQSETLLNEDLSNVVDVGKEIFDATNVDNYVRSLVDHIGKVIFVNRPYNGIAPKVFMDGWEYGSVLEKITADIPEATANESWELQDGTSYDPNIFYKPKVSAKFFNSKVTFEVPMSFTERQVKESFSSATQLNAFISMLYDSVDKSMTIKVDGLIQRTINNMIGMTLHEAFPSGNYNSGSKVRAVNLLYLYNQQFPQSTITKGEALTSLEFLRFASRTMSLYVDRLKAISTVFNGGGKPRFTPKDKLHIVMLSEFVSSSSYYLQSDTFHKDLVELPMSETVTYWQGSGNDYALAKTSAIDIKTSEGDNVVADGILAVMFDHDALGVCNQDKRVTTNYNPKAEFYNNWYKFDCGFFNDNNENFVVFYIA